MDEARSGGAGAASAPGADPIGGRTEAGRAACTVGLPPCGVAAAGFEAR